MIARSNTWNCEKNELHVLWELYKLLSSFNLGIWEASFDVIQHSVTCLLLHGKLVSSFAALLLLEMILTSSSHSHLATTSNVESLCSSLSCFQLSSTATISTFDVNY